jgi:aspartate kinase
MALVVQKYGGTSVGDVERIRNVARRVLNTKKQGHGVVVVVSAMAGETDKLIRLAQQVTSSPDEREMDVLVSTGEQVSIALLTIALKDMRVDAKSYLGFQIKIATDSAFGKARITSIESEKVLSDLKNGRIVVVAGFQGIDESGNITTLGRGGSDTTAVKSIQMWMEFIRQIPTSAPRRESYLKSLMMRCWRWPVWGRKFYRSVLWSLLKNTMFPFM